MDKKLLIGLVLGFGAFYLFEKVGGKDCGCGKGKNLEAEVLDDTTSLKESDEPTCEEAVALVMAEIRKTSRMSEAGFKMREKQELAKCQKMASASR